MRSTITVVKWALLVACAAPLYGCSFLDSFVPKKGDSTDVIDRQQNLSVNDFKNLSAINRDPDLKDDTIITATTGPVTAPPIPDIAQVLAAPRPPKIENAKLVTLAVTDDVPLRDVLFELGRLAGVDVEVGPGLDKTGINLRATDRPFNEVVERIAEVAHLRYSSTGHSIRIEQDLPYIKNYSLDFLNMVRSSKSTYNLSTNVLSSSGSSGGSSGGSSSSSSSSSSGGSSSGGGFGQTGSTANIDSSAESDLFSALEASITEILSYSPAGPDATGPTGTTKTASASASASGAAGSNANFVINRQSNVLTVNGTDEQQKMVEHYLTLMSRNASAQVLIEAKIVEVSLADQFLSGVNWNQILGNANKGFARVGTYNPPALNATSVNTARPAIADASSFAAGLTSGDLDVVISAAQQFGTTRTLSSPRLSAINNQLAVLTFAKNDIYFNCTAQAGTVVASTGINVSGSTATQPTVSCQQQTQPIGIIMSILPSINLNTQEVTLNVRPTLTREVGQVSNPANLFAAAIANSNCTNNCVNLDSVNTPQPIVEVREIDSVMKVKSGGIMIIGGLMEDSSRNTESGVPGAAEVPFLGNLFKSRSEDSLKRELIIFVKATIVNSDGSSDPIDRKVYNKFISDPRPLFPNPTPGPVFH